LVEIDSIGFGQILTNVETRIYDFILAKSDLIWMYFSQNRLNWILPNISCDKLSQNRQFFFRVCLGQIRQIWAKADSAKFRSRPARLNSPKFWLGPTQLNTAKFWSRPVWSKWPNLVYGRPG